ncbi:MAG: ABC transporter ATP-binding protein [Deltaproteobacteria bacterium]|nr:ABC transporter ATP-binding protein [Deltaproteobacteria bacterium]
MTSAIAAAAAPAAALAAPSLEARALVRDLGDEVKTRILHGIDLAIAPGEFVSVTGPSGSGKSTLLYLLGALDRPTSGDVLIEGVSTVGLDDRARGALRGERLGFVFQFHFLLPEFTALENVIIPMLRRRDIPRADARARALAVLDQLGIGELGGRRPTQLSGGQQQRVSIARAIAHGPRILLADEPTGNLDSAAGEAVLGIFETLVRDRGMTIVMVTHEPSYARRAQREIRLRDGRIVEIATGAPATVTTR